MNTPLNSPANPMRIVILGGGFGGLYSALHFEKTIAADLTVEVTLVSRENSVLFTPMLHEVAAGDLEPSDIVCPLRSMLKRVRFLQADVDFAFPRDLTQHMTLHGIDRVSQLLAYARQHPVVSGPAASATRPALQSSS
jgi:NADH dehydrogenase